MLDLHKVIKISVLYTVPIPETLLNSFSSVLELMSA